MEAGTGAFERSGVAAWSNQVFPVTAARQTPQHTHTQHTTRTHTHSLIQPSLSGKHTITHTETHTLSEEQIQRFENKKMRPRPRCDTHTRSLTPTGPCRTSTYCYNKRYATTTYC